MNQIIQKLHVRLYKLLDLCIAIGCLKQFSGMCSHADFIHRYSFFIFAVLEKILSYIASCMVAYERKKIDSAITKQAIAIAIVLNHVE